MVEGVDDLVRTLMGLEAQFWDASSAGSGEQVAALLADDALAAGAFGVLDKTATAGAAEGQPPFEYWRWRASRGRCG